MSSWIDSFPDYSARLLRIKDREGGRVIPFTLNRVQAAIDAEIDRQLAHGVPAKVIILKSRRLGVSTYVAARFCHRIFTTAHQRGIVVAHKGEEASKLFGIYERMYSQLPDMHEGVPVKPRRTGGRGKRLTFAGMDSELDVSNAGSEEAGRGGEAQLIHLCLDGGSLVHLPNGDAIAMRDVQPGAWVRTHTGALAQVAKVWPAQRLGRAVVKVSAWLTCDSLTLTADHKVWTARGWIPAGELTAHDELGIPIRRFAGTLKSIRLDPHPRKGNHGKFTIAGDIPLNRETGFFVGYYLAEGSIHRQSTHACRPASIHLAHHVDEEPLAIAACSGISQWTRSKKTTNPSGKRGATTVYGATFAEWVLNHFGEKDEKRIPEWVFQSPAEFAEGIVLGYVSGDGSKGMATHGGYTSPSISITSIRRRLLIQCRNLIAALGWGWAGIYRRPDKPDPRGWNTRTAWMLHVNGLAAIEIRKRLDYRLPGDLDATLKRRARTQKYRMDDHHVWVRVKSVNLSDSDELYDLEVDHPDHSFETPIGVCANSEAAFYVDPEGYLQGLLPSLHKTGEGMLILESTAGKWGPGADWWEKTWKDARDGENAYKALFFPWYLEPSFRMPFAIAKADWTEEEQALAKQYRVDGHQIAWLREVQDTDCFGNEDRRRKEYPATPEEAFTAIGDRVWDAETLQAVFERRDPLYTAHITATKGIVQGPNGALTVWEEPIDRPGIEYVIGADPAAGIGGDMAVAEVYRVSRKAGQWPVQVAEFAIDSEDPITWAGSIARLGHWYKRALLACEVNGVGYGVQAALQTQLHYPRLHRWVHFDHLKATGDVWGWQTTWKTKQIMLALADWLFRTRHVVLRSPELLDELMGFQLIDADAEREQYEGVRGDDRIMASFIALASWFQWIYPGIPLAQLRDQLAGLYGSARKPDEAEQPKQDAWMRKMRAAEQARTGGDW